jgi:hypothetical protein
MFRSGRDWGLESLKRAFDISWHGNVARAFGVIPSQSESAVASAGPIGADVVVFLKCCDKIVGISGVEVFYTEVVDSKSENGSARCVAP